MTYVVKPIGVVRSELKDRQNAPRQGNEGAPDAWLEISADVEEALDGLAAGDDVVVLTWLDRAQREVLKVHPRDEAHRPLAGVFATRSQDRPNPIGLHRVTILEIADRRLKVGPLEAFDGTPIVDIKPVLSNVADS